MGFSNFIKKIVGFFPISKQTPTFAFCNQEQCTTAVKKCIHFGQYQKNGNAGIAYKNRTGKVNRIGMRSSSLQRKSDLKPLQVTRQGGDNLASRGHVLK
jgi:hypothetical protein